MMVKVTKLTDNEPTYINPDKICYLEEREHVNGEKYTRIHFDMFSISIKETTVTLLALIRAKAKAER